MKEQWKLDSVCEVIAAVAGIFFSASCCAIFWLKKRGKMLINRDDGLHCDFACHLHSKLLYPASPGRIRNIIFNAVAIECSCVRKSLHVALIGMKVSVC